MNQLQQKKERTIILDACALEAQKAMEIIENAERVIVLTSTIRELDKNKREDNQYGRNIRYIGKKIRQDPESKKYVCISGYEKYRYNDDNIIDYCIWHNETTILTCDNYLCAKAKANGIKYIFPELSKKCKTNKKSEQGESKHSSCNVKGVTYKNGKLLILRQSLIDPNFNIIIIRNGRIIKFNLERNVQLNIGDTIIRVKNNENVNLSVFEITGMQSKNYAQHIEEMSLQKPIKESLKKVNLPLELKEQINFLLSDEDYKNNDKGQVYIQNKRIYPNKGMRNTYICLERNETFIKKQECKEGDLVYVASTNKKRKAITLNIYKVIKVLNMYNIEKIHTYNIKSINEIYLINCSDKIKEKMREYYIHNVRY
ncbi:MAG: hypothetical protein HFJ42_07050 [Clostridia bacterium]|nr:hypothetical protein [Clostridia bacterium]